MKRLIKGNVNIGQASYTPLAYVNQLDDITLELNILSNGTNLDVTGQKVSLYAKRSNKTVVEQLDGFIIASSKITVDVKNSCFAVPGITELQLELIDSTGKATVSSFYINVNKSISNEDSITANNEIAILTEAKEMEPVRQENELERVEAEITRVQDEASRVSAETGRVEAENLRVTAEAGREGRLQAVEGKSTDNATQIADIVKQVNSGSGIGEKAITPIKTTFFEVVKNLFNKNEVQLDKSLSSSNGVTVDVSGYCTSNFIKIEPNTQFVWNYRHTIAWYDTNKTFISGVSSSTSTTEKTFVSPINACYVRFALKLENLNTAQLEKGSVSTKYEDFYMAIPKTLTQKHDFTIDDISNKSITSDKIEFIKIGKNIFNKNTVIADVSVSSADGTVVSNPGYFVSDFIKVDANTVYTRSDEHTLAFYDINKTFISGITGSEDICTFTTPSNCEYIRTSAGMSTLNKLQVEKGSVKTAYEEYKENIEYRYLPKETYKPKFIAEFNTIKNEISLNDNNNSNLCLIATKLKNIQGKTPETVGYLYLNMATQKIYYSSNLNDTPKFLFDWNLTLSNNTKCEEYQASISYDGDIIFLRNYLRENPIIYPSNDYSNPCIVDFGQDLKPYGYLTNISIVHDVDNFIFGEYTTHKLTDEQNNDPRCIWKVTKPYTNKANWQIKHRFKHVYFESPVSNEPNNEIGHIHTIVKDFYSNRLYCSTGDIDRHCRLWHSTDNGETWSEIAVGGQKWRALGIIFLKDCAYWGTDSHYANHALYKIPRDSNGILQFDQISSICKLDDMYYTGTQPTYANILLREPYGILFLDRAEPRDDNKLDLMFYSLKYNELFKCTTLDKNLEFVVEINGRHGFPNQVSMNYQSNDCDFVITGGGDKIRPNTLNLLNNTASNYIGAVKIKIREA